MLSFCAARLNVDNALGTSLNEIYTFDSDKVSPIPIGKFCIGKYQLVVRPAWEIGPNDPDVVAIQKDDDPIIPEDEKNAPVLRALHRFDKRKRRKRH